MAEIRMIAKVNYYKQSVEFTCCYKGNDKELYDCLGNPINPINALLSYNVSTATDILSPYPIKVFSWIGGDFYNDDIFRELPNLTTSNPMALLIPRKLYNDSDHLLEWLDNNFDELEKLYRCYENYKGIPESYLMFIGDYLGNNEGLPHISANLI